MKNQYDENDKLWQHTYLDENKNYTFCNCGCNVFHHAYDGKYIHVICNACGISIGTMRSEFVDKELQKGIWK